MKYKLIFLFFLMLAKNVLANEEPEFFLPPDGVVKDRQVALAIADVILSHFYGEEKIKKEHPFKIELLKNDVWLVTGTLNSKKSYGGVASIKIRRRDGAVLGFTHTK